MGAPVAKIKRPGFEHFERIAAARDVLQMPLSRAPNDIEADFHIAAANSRGKPADILEEFRVLEQRNFNGFDKSTEEIAVGQGRQRRSIIDYGPRDAERADPVFLLK